jgi:hypothetical protein
MFMLVSKIMITYIGTTYNNNYLISGKNGAEPNDRLYIIKY